MALKAVREVDLIELSRYLRLLVWGEPGTGKTTLLASACLDPLTAPMLFVDYKSQVGSLASNSEYLAAMVRGDLIIISIDRYKDLEDIFTWLISGRGANGSLDGLMKSLGHPDDLMPKSVGIDSVTELQATEVMRRAGNPMGKFRSELSMPEIKDWGKLKNQFTLLGDVSYHLPYHMMFAGLEEVDYADAEIGKAPRVTGYRLAMQGASQRLFPAYAMTIMRLEREAPNKEGHYNVGTMDSSLSKVKEQTGLIPKKIYSPTIPKLVKCLNSIERK